MESVKVLLVDTPLYTHMVVGMGSKNIAISEEAYLRLRRARRHPGESFSQVIQRGTWDTATPTAQSWLDHLTQAPEVDDAIIEGIEAGQLTDQPPADKWSC